MTYKRCRFTILELLFSIAIIAILTAMLLPTLSESRARARFVRWLQFNNQCSTDPTCVVNLNFQEGEGGILKNSAHGCEADGYNADDYNGIIRGDYEWTKGRWTQGKKAVQLDGYSTLIELPKNQYVDFTGGDGFTVIVSMKFDRLDQFDGIFGKCYMRNKVNGFPQYVLYYSNSGRNKNSKDTFQLDIGKLSVSFDRVNAETGVELPPIDLESWYHIVLRNKVIDDEQVVDLFLNGHKLKSTYNNLGTGNKERDAANLALGCIRWLVTENRDGEHVPAPYGKPDNFIKGKIDEFLVYNRPLTDNEIKAHYAMSAERL